ncbi:hypothetical protein CVV68_12430 [Arthrobacter livingstonensis]|uniref:Uncharacterized protein n=1 Tax=Arthrobacter livingstonensis TaxID=670078 RepID=A0A2V5L671_9MICC|nr:hypothetical protein [Arthrobacter livingstonensis]PYI66895.1 hypothetical protein CVV68_12430 [Arthrobacter livingstonensis]
MFFLIRNITGTRNFGILKGIATGLGLLGAAALGFRMGGIHLEAVGMTPQILNILNFLLFTLAVIAIEVIAKDNSPISLLPRLRFLWESGLSSRFLAASVLLVLGLLVSLLLIPPFALLAWATLGVLPWAGLLIPWGAMMASLAGGTISKASVLQPDGSSEPSLAAALISVALALPCLGLATLSAPGPAAGFLYVVLLSGASALCLRHRIQQQPSHS